MNEKKRIGCNQYKQKKDFENWSIRVNTYSWQVEVLQDLHIKAHQGGILTDYIVVGYMTFGDYLKLRLRKICSTYMYDFYR